MSPPATRNAGSVMPSAWKRYRPTAAKAMRRMVMATQAAERRAPALRGALVARDDQIGRNRRDGIDDEQDRRKSDQGELHVCLDRLPYGKMPSCA